MSNQHRATPEQWATAEKWATGDGFGVMHACLLELRARVEALEAAANDRQQDQDAECAAAPSPAPSLVDQVANAICSVPHDYEAESRAAIRAVAAWLQSEYPRREGYGTAWANMLDQEAAR
jgi:hypothetical protein